MSVLRISYKKEGFSRDSIQYSNIDMKFFAIVFSTCIAGSLAGDNTDSSGRGLGVFIPECSRESGVDSAAVHNLMNRIVDEGNPELECFLACILRRGGIMNDDGTFNEEGFRARISPDIPEEEIEAVLNACEWTEGPDACKTATTMTKCYWQNSKTPLLSW